MLLTSAGLLKNRTKLSRPMNSQSNSVQRVRLKKNAMPGGDEEKDAIDDRRRDVERVGIGLERQGPCLGWSMSHAERRRDGSCPAGTQTTDFGSGFGVLAHQPGRPSCCA